MTTKNKVRTAVGVALVLALLILPAAALSAPDPPVDLTIQTGGLFLTDVAIVCGVVPFSFFARTDLACTNASSWLIEDSRFTELGWKLALSMGNIEKVGDASIFIPTGSLRGILGPTRTTALAGTLVGVSHPAGTNLIVNTVAITAISSLADGDSNGLYDLAFEWDIDIPAGQVPADYSAILTASLTSGP